jgi:thymidylate synthase
MVSRPHRNISFATAESFDAVLREGATVTVRGKETKELRNRLTVITRPLERCVFLPGRRNDIFAQVSETLWVIAGRDDLPWLTRYLPRAPYFSDDDGQTWHGAYGPRLRAWAGQIDQVDRWRQLLTADRNSRRVVGVLFDPTRDFVAESRDIPCNNWLCWLLRDGLLHLNVAIRSNDAVWGFSGVNAFEWSVLQEMMALWVGARVGDLTFFATSYHIYAHHYERAAEIVSRFYGVSPYDFGISSPPFVTRWTDFAGAVSDWFEVEEQLRLDPRISPREGAAIRDPFLASTLRLVRLKWGAERWTDDELATELAALPEDDFATAAYEYFGRTRPDLLSNIRQPNIADFFRACELAKSDPAAELKSAIKHLHARKNASYAGAWKRRGERVSVLPNIARKVDRLLAFVNKAASLDGETLLDTALDLYVYVVKYRLFLAEIAGANISPLGASAPQPFSDHDENFNLFVDGADFIRGANGEFAREVDGICVLFEDIWRGADANATLADRQQWAAELAVDSERLVAIVIRMNPADAHEFVRHERG